MKGVKNMSTMLHGETHMRMPARKFRETRHPAMKGSVTVPMTLANEATTSSARTRQNPPSAVELARIGVDSDANAALMKLRELVVGPTQQLNEARLEELMKIFEEREAELRAVMRDVQKRNSELEVALKQSSLEQLNAFKSEFQALTDGMSSESKKAISSIREDISASRKEALSLAQEAKTAVEKKLEAERIRTVKLVDSETGKLRVELESSTGKLEAALIANQRESQLQMSRVLKEASECLARLATAS
jgi:hypothetical protein